MVAKKLASILFLLQFCLGQAIESQVSSERSQQPQTRITVFVHGIMSIRPHLSLSNLCRFMCDEIQETHYARTVNLMRKDPIFYQNQAMQQIGFVKVDPYVTPKKNNASAALAMVFETLSKFAQQECPVIDHYYTYGWTGLLSPSQRYSDSCYLYKALSEEIEKFREQGIEPSIRIIGYSHGGNVCLNLARVRLCHNLPYTFTIDELILMGMPVQPENDYLVSDPLFKKIYHIYSRGDRVQKLDFFSTKRFFSRRLFKPRRGFALPNKLIQVQIKCTRLTRSKCPLIQQRRINYKQRAYNLTSEPIIGGKAHFMRDASPGHTELWFFGWTPVNYRRYFPLYPLPIVAIIPIILQVVDDFQEKDLFHKPTLVDIRPDHEVMIIKNQKSKQILTFARFLSQSQVAQLADLVCEYAPDNFTIAKYESHIKKAYVQAHQEEQEERYHSGWFRPRKKQCACQATFECPYPSPGIFL